MPKSIIEHGARRLAAALLGAWLGAGGPPPTAAEAPAPEAAAVSAEDALAAYDRFMAAPVERLAEAPAFLRYMQGGAVHTVLNANVVFWMYRDVAPDVQAVLYAAYMGGNLASQLRGAKRGDDPEAGMRAALDAYADIKRARPGYTLPELEQLAAARAENRLGAAVAALAGASASP